MIKSFLKHYIMLDFPNYDYKNEYNILKKINDSNIIKINETYENTDYFYTVMDYYERGDLYFNMKENIKYEVS